MAVSYTVKTRLSGSEPKQRRSRAPREDRSAVSGIGDDGGNGDDSATETVNPADIADADSSAPVTEQPERKRRGRKPGSGAGKKKSLALEETLKTTLVVAHFALGAAMKSPEMALNEQEAAALANATAEVLAFYDTTIPAEAMAWVNLAVCAGGIYYGKLGAIVERKRSERAKTVNAPAFALGATT